MTPATTSGHRGLPDAYATHRYRVLFYALLVTLCAAPVSAALRWSGNVLQFFLAFSLLTALFGVPGRRLRAILVLVAATAMALRAAPASAVGAELSLGALAVNTVLALLATAIAIRFALRARVVTAEHIYAALSAYLLGGLVFGVAHWTVEMVSPGSYGEAGASAPTGLPLRTALYYSFVTLATVGYGDVVPRSDVARGIAAVEAVAGQLYIAVMIARLVGAQIQRAD